MDFYLFITMLLVFDLVIYNTNSALVRVRACNTYLRETPIEA